MKNTFTFSLYNTELFGQYWQPQTIEAVIVLVHGMGEHSSRYEQSVVPYLLKNNIAIVTFDLFGHGNSKGKRGHCPSYKALLESIECVIEKSKMLFPESPVFLYGHSLGGNLVINYALKENHNLKGVIATSPLLRLAFKPPKLKMVLGKLIYMIYPSLRLSSELDVTAISRNISEVKRYKEDALVHDKISPMFVFPVTIAGEWAIANAGKSTTPTLILHGTGDKITNYKASEEFCKNTKQAKLVVFENGYHELHHDLCKEEFIQTINKWLDKRKLA
jgi:alpha-beta hydrolase superfamily lysophospholipase